jgi:hypothetical protein
MTRPRLKSPPQANRLTKCKASQRPAAPSAKKPSRAPAEPEQAAKAAIAHEGRAIPSSPDKVKLTLNLSLSREHAERLTAKAIRKGKNLEALVAEILDGAPE